MSRTTIGAPKLGGNFIISGTAVVTFDGFSFTPRPNAAAYNVIHIIFIIILFVREFGADFLRIFKECN